MSGYVSHLATDDGRFTLCGEPWQGWQAPADGPYGGGPEIAPFVEPRPHLDSIRQCQACFLAARRTRHEHRLPLNGYFARIVPAALRHGLAVIADTGESYEVAIFSDDNRSLYRSCPVSKVLLRDPPALDVMLEHVARKLRESLYSGSPSP